MSNRLRASRSVSWQFAQPNSPSNKSPARVRSTLGSCCVRSYPRTTGFAWAHKQQAITKQISHPPTRGNDDILAFTLPGAIIPIIACGCGPTFTGTPFSRLHPAALSLSERWSKAVGAAVLRLCKLWRLCTGRFVGVAVAGSRSRAGRFETKSRSQRSGGPGSMHAIPRRIYCRYKVSGMMMPC